MRLQAFERGAVGVAFRMVDPRNTFLLRFDAAQGSTRLGRVEDGEYFLLSQVEGPPYREGVWQRVRIEMHHGRIKVAVSADKTWTPVIK